MKIIGVRITERQVPTGKQTGEQSEIKEGAVIGNDKC